MVPCLIAVPGYLVHEHLRAFLWPGVGGRTPADPASGLNRETCDRSHEITDQPHLPGY